MIAESNIKLENVLSIDETLFLFEECDIEVLNYEVYKRMFKSSGPRDFDQMTVYLEDGLCVDIVLRPYGELSASIHHEYSNDRYQMLHWPTNRRRWWHRKRDGQFSKVYNNFYVSERPLSEMLLKVKLMLSNRM